MIFTFQRAPGFFYLFLLASIFEKSTSVSLEKDLTISNDQQLILAKFKERVADYLPHEYMKKEIYLIRWLRAKQFDIKAAERMLYDNIQWRQENDMDTILQEDWTDFEASYKYWTEGEDNQGRPVAFVSIGSWDLRKAIVTGQREKLLRYIDRAIEGVTTKLRDLQDQNKNVSQINLVGNIAGYNIIQQGCIQCIPIYIYFVSTYELHYPGLANKVLLLNTPEIFQVVLNAIRPFMSPLTREALEVFGTNRRDWEPIVYKNIARDQLPEEVRGTKVYDDE